MQISVYYSLIYLKNIWKICFSVVYVYLSLLSIDLFFLQLTDETSYSNGGKIALCRGSLC